MLKRPRDRLFPQCIFCGRSRPFWDTLHCFTKKCLALFEKSPAVAKIRKQKAKENLESKNPSLPSTKKIRYFQRKTKRRVNMILVANGEAKTIQQWADFFKVSVPAIYYRLRIKGQSMQEIFDEYTAAGAGTTERKPGQSVVRNNKQFTEFNRIFFRRKTPGT